MEFGIVKKDKKIKLYIDNEEKIIDKDYCIIIGNIFNLNKLSNKNISDSDKVLELYDKYKNELFYKLDGEFSILIIKDNNITLARDRMGSKLSYYTKINDEYIYTNTLKFIIDNYKNELEIDKKILANYLCYYYVQEPYTIFKNVYKVSAGCYVENITEHCYYNLIEEYQKNKNTILDYKKAEKLLDKNINDAINKRIGNKKNIGIFFSSGVDSSIIASICKKNKKLNVNTYTIGFDIKSKNEAPDAKKIAEKLKTNHHEYYLTSEMAKEIIHEISKAYPEPFSDHSMIPIYYLNKIVDKNMDVVLTGDGADQLFLGSNVYDRFTLKYKIADFIRGRSIFMQNKKYAMKILSIKPKSNYKFKNLKEKKQIRYMLFDIKGFLANRLFTKVSMPAQYYNVNVSHPYIDNNCVETTLKLKHEFKYFKKEKKYILKNILYKYNDKQDYCKKKGFGIPLKEWIIKSFYEDIVKYSNEEALNKQGIFEYKKIKKEVNKLKKGKLNNREYYAIFSYLMFQLWYKEYINDLWK